VIYLVGGPAWGALSDRFGGSPGVLAAATALAAGGALALIAARGFLPVLACASLMATGIAGITPILDARALETSGVDRSGYAPLRAFGSLAFIIAATLTGIVVDRTSLAAALVVTAAFMVLTGLVGLSLRPARLQPSGLRQLRPAIELFRRGRLRLFLVGATLSAVGLGAVLGFMPVRLAELGAAPAMSGLAYSVGAAVEVPLMLGFPGLARRFGVERLLVLGAVAFALRSVIVGLGTDPWILVAASPLGGVGFACLLIGGVSHISRRVPAEIAATAQGIYQGGTNGFAQVVAGLAGGAIAAAFGLSGMYLVAAALGAAAVLIVAVAVGLPTDRRSSVEAVR
jgi:MFS family permease